MQILAHSWSRSSIPVSWTHPNLIAAPHSTESGLERSNVCNQSHLVCASLWVQNFALAEFGINAKQGFSL